MSDPPRTPREGAPGGAPAPGAGEALARLAAIVESSHDAIVALDDKEMIQTWNLGAVGIYGYAPEEALGRHASLFVPEDRYGEFHQMVVQACGDTPVRCHETVHLAKNRVPVDVSVTISPVRHPTGRTVGVSLVCRDVTEQRWITRTLDSTLQTLQSALDEARQAEARSRQFLADAAHQLRRPIAGIRATVETMLRGTDEEQRDRLFAAMVRETARASDLVADLLRLARLDAGERLGAAPCDLAAVSADEADRTWVLAPHLDIVMNVTDPPPPPARLDERAVREILANLLDNARRHARSQIEISVRAAQDSIEIRIADDGPGLPEHMAERAFDRFVSLDAKGGSGLGLPIARGLARAQGGDLVYQDGAFLVSLPLRAARPSGDTPS